MSVFGRSVSLVIGLVLGSTLGQSASTLAWKSEAGFRSASVQPGPGTGPGLTLQPASATGIGFTNHLAEATVARNRLLELGSGVALGDIDGDGRVDVYFCRLEGDNVLYRNLGDWRFEDITARAGVACPDQCSTGCNFADLDGDGRLDLVASNWGRNWRTDQPGASNATVQRIYGEFHEPGQVLTVLASWDPHSGRQTPWRSWSSLSQAIPALTERAHSHREFAVLSVDSLLGPLATRGWTLNAETFDSMIILNRGGHFEGVPLSAEAQFAPAFGLSIADFDGDGCEDFFLAQNFLA